ncbi:TIR domain-containing protein [Agarivorans sp. DSG3-1]|uniref:TIR domain-containing protein n=1 Tax=Agarivorans sp. DSG3-1 TaxID=3342249 RepID=UPI00398F2E2D
MSIEFLESDFDKVSYIASVLTARATGMAFDPREYEVLRKELLNAPGIAPHLPSLVRQHRSLDSFWGFIQPKFSTYAERRTYLSEQFTQLLDALEFGTLVQSTSMSSPAIQPPSSSVSKLPSVTRNKRKVFIVHGRDNEAKQEVSRFIESLGLEAIVLHEQASSGMTIIEKIEHYSNDADFALVLYTACDKGRGASETTVPARDRARQNVVFEHGYLMAKLGRENVCSLVKGQIETPNDISGVVYIELDGFGAWKNDVSKELKACGYKISQVF